MIASLDKFLIIACRYVVAFVQRLFYFLPVDDCDSETEEEVLNC